MDLSTVAETFRMIIEGDDITAPKSLLRNISQESAAKRVRGFPYSILENLWHTDLWQTIWIDKIEGRTPTSWMEDWQTPDASEWGAVRTSFLKNLGRAYAVASAKPFRHKMKSKDVAVRNLLNLAVHDAYHIGQITLMKRVLRKMRG